MLTPIYSTKFKKDLKLMEKRGLSMVKIMAVMNAIVHEIPLPPKNQEHLLQGDYTGFLECHVELNWLMIYQIGFSTKEVYFGAYWVAFGFILKKRLAASNSHK